MKDREEIVSAFKQCGLPGACLKCQYGAEREGCYAALRHDVLELLKKQPEQKFFVDSDGKITPLPMQKHGHWIISGRFLPSAQCSACKDTYIGDCRTFNYCPNCGAKMDEEAKQNET